MPQIGQWMDFGFLALSLLLQLGVLGWMFWRLEFLIAVRGSLDLYFHFLAWSVTLQLILYGAYVLLAALIFWH